MTKRSDPAYPTESANLEDIGVTKREYFAIRALDAIISEEGSCNNSLGKARQCASAVSYAETLVEELNQAR